MWPVGGAVKFTGLLFLKQGLPIVGVNFLQMIFDSLISLK